MAGVTAPMTSSYIVERSLYNAAAQVQQDIRLAQQLAITHSTTSKFRIHFDPANNFYTVETSEDANYETSTGKIITRNFNDAYGFPVYFSINDPKSVVFDASSVPPDTTIDLNFDNLGHPHLGNGYVNLQNSSGSKKIQIIVSVIGRVNIEWKER
jgi:Tfp pilus assembly protein FimT